MELKYLSFLNDCRTILGNIKGIEIEEITQIESKFNVKLPVAYKEYLLFMGKESGNILGGYYTEYPVVTENREDAIYALNFDDRKKDEDKPLFKDSFYFFAQWQGGVFFFLDCNDDNNNPPVYIFEDSLKIYKYKDSFSDFIRDEGLKPLLDMYNINK